MLRIDGSENSLRVAEEHYEWMMQASRAELRARSSMLKLKIWEAVLHLLPSHSQYFILMALVPVLSTHSPILPSVAH